MPGAFEKISICCAGKSRPGRRCVTVPTASRLATFWSAEGPPTAFRYLSKTCATVICGTGCRRQAGEVVFAEWRRHRRVGDVRHADRRTASLVAGKAGHLRRAVERGLVDG